MIGDKARVQNLNAALLGVSDHLVAAFAGGTGKYQLWRVWGFIAPVRPSIDECGMAFAWVLYARGIQHKALL